jgi:hypothetical protein
MDYVPLFIANGFYKNRTAFKRQHVVYNTFTKFPKIDRYIEVGRLARLRSQILVEMPFERHTRRRYVEVDLPYDKVLLDRVLKDRWHVYEDRPLRDIAEMFLVARKVVNSDPSRLEMVKELWKSHPRLIVFYNFNYELYALRSLAESFGMGIGSKTTTDHISNSATTSIAMSTAGSNGSTSGSSISLVENSRGISSEWMRKQNVGYDPSQQNNAGWNTDTVTTSSSSQTPGVIGSGPTATKQRLSRTSFATMPSSLLGNEGSPTAASYSTSGTPSTRYPQSSEASSAIPEVAEWNGHRHQPVPESSSWIYLVQYTAGAEAWNCVTTDAMAMYSQTYSWKTREQAYGRIDRLNTPFKDLWYYGFTSESFVDQAIARSLKGKENFNVKKYSSMFEG